MSEVVTTQERELAAGRKAWADGLPMPGGLALGGGINLFWLGYMAARGVDYLKRRDVCEKLGGDPEKLNFYP